MRYLLYQLGDGAPEGLAQSVDMLNKTQTIWMLSIQSAMTKPDSFYPSDNLSIIPQGDTSFFSIGVTRGRVDQKTKLFSSDFSAYKALISEFEWRTLKNYDPPEVFWAFALANICFQVSINSCSNEYCLGYKSYSIEKLLLNLLSLHICDECEKKLFEKNKYRVPEIRNLVELLKKPKRYDMLPPLEEPFLPTFERQVRRQEGKQIFQGLGIITIMHFLEDLVPFVKALIALGASAESIVLIVKPYPYLHKTKVHSHLRHNYPDIRVEYLDDLPPNDVLLKEIVEYCRDRSAQKKVIVIEDGGYLVPFLHRNFSEDQNFCAGAVEQTTKGIRKDEELEDEFKKASRRLYFPVLNVAKSKFKDEYESPLVGGSVVNSIQKILKDEHFSGKRALVVGFGAAGREVASALVRIGMIVTVYDAELDKVAAARVRGFEASQSASTSVKDVKLIIGTTGKTSINCDVLEHIGNGTILVSASSDRIEIDVEYLRKICADSSYVSGVGTYYVRRKGMTEDRYLLLADGFPINFYFDSGIPTRSIDPVLAQLFIGAVHIATKHKEMEPGISNVMNELIKDYALLDDFINTYND